MIFQNHVTYKLLMHIFPTMQMYVHLHYTDFKSCLCILFPACMCVWYVDSQVQVRFAVNYISDCLLYRVNAIICINNVAKADYCKVNDSHSSDKYFMRHLWYINNTPLTPLHQ